MEAVPGEDNAMEEDMGDHQVDLEVHLMVVQLVDMAHQAVEQAVMEDKVEFLVVRLDLEVEE